MESDLSSENRLGPLEKAIDSCRNIKEEHQKSAKIILIFMVMEIVVFLIYLSIQVPINERYSFAMFVILVGLSSILYRHHIKEAAKMQELEIDFRRIEVAAKEFKKQGFQSEVRTALTKNIFSQKEESLLKIGKSDTTPNYPLIDFSQKVMEKILETIDISFKRHDK